LGASPLRQSSCVFCCASSCTGLAGLKIIRWVTHPDPKQTKEEQDRLKDIFWGSFQQMRVLMKELGV